MILLFAAMLLAAEPEAAAPPATPAPAASEPAAAAPAAPAVKTAKQSKDQVVCWDETPTGTRFSKRICATRAELDQRRRDDQDWKMMLRAHPTGGN
jgi:hypothetical protein